MGTLYLLSPDGTRTEHDEEQVRVQWKQGQLQGTVLCWKEGLPDWTPLPFYFSSTAKAPFPSAPNRQPGASRHYSLRKDPWVITFFLLVMLGLSLLLESVILVSYFQQYSLLEGTGAGEETIKALESRQRILTGVHLIVYFITAVTFLKWIYRANYNSHCFGTRDMNFSPGWSIGWYFIPFMNLYKPYLAMSEIWKVSLDPQRWEAQKTSPLLGCWWALWLMANAAGQISSRINMGTDDYDSLKMATLLSIVFSIVTIPLCIAAALMVFRLVRQQYKLTQTS